MGVIIKILPNALFNQIALFKEEPMEFAKMDSSYPSMVRKKSSIRYNYSGFGSNSNITETGNIIPPGAGPPSINNIS